jgi:hypothetical protein
LQGSHGLLVIVFHHTFLLSFEGLIGWRSNIEKVWQMIESLATYCGILRSDRIYCGFILPRSGLLEHSG